jgi:multiple sugar transport system ATP-binding protein
MASLELLSVNKSYGNDSCVIRDVSIHVQQGEFCVFVGPSGCGKSTLLRMLAGLEDITAGELRVGGVRMNNVPPAQRGVAMVFQNYALFPHLSVYDNMGFGLSVTGTPKATLDKKVREAARVLQLDHLLDRKPKQLSGGQRQRVAIGRAIVREPGVFLFDEPLSNLDAALRGQTRLEIAKLHRDYGRASTVYVTHDQVEAMTLADRILLLNTGDAVPKEGSIAQFGSPMELYHRPRTLFVAGFMGSPKMNFATGALQSSTPESATVLLDSGEALSARVNAQALPPGARVTVGIRPEHLALGCHGQHLLRTVQWQECLGEVTYGYLDDAPGGPGWMVRAPGATRFHKGERVALSAAPDALHVFDDKQHALPRTVDLPC